MGVSWLPGPILETDMGRWGLCLEDCELPELSLALGAVPRSKVWRDSEEG